MFKQLWTSFYQALFPITCLSCGKEGLWLCKDCQKNIKYLRTDICPFCFVKTKNFQLCSNCQKHYYLSGVLTVSKYKKPISTLIQTLKYQGNQELAKVLATIAASKLKRHLSKNQKILTAIPLHKNKERNRGFNQASLIAQELASILKLEYQPNLLIRTRDTQSQTKLTRPERFKNLKAAFKLRSKINLKNKTIVLVDDVMTTGATLNEAAKALKPAKPKQIWGLVIAKR